MEYLFKDISKKTFLFIILAELISYSAFIFHSFNNFAFWAVVILILALAIKKLEYGVWIACAELFIGSKGYLFYFDYKGIVISIRLALWLIIMSVWLAGILYHWARKKNLKIEFFNSKFFPYFFIFSIFILLGLINGYLSHNAYDNIFFDFNGWLYLLLIFLFYAAIKNNNGINKLLQIFSASIIWLSLKTLILLYFFSHDIYGILENAYKWARTTGVGEITQIQGGFFRIFFQSHIYILIGLSILIFYLLKILVNKQEKKEIIYNFLILILFFSIILISFSRSFWIGLIAGLIIFYIYLFWQKIKWQVIINLTGLILFSSVLGLALIILVAQFPYPHPASGFNTAELITKRAGQIEGEAAVSSRWDLLPVLWLKIKDNLFLGQGFGSTVTYASSDPRVLENNPSGSYTTYAFEWGWLDIWLKLGLWGLISYLILIGKLCIRAFSDKNNYLFLSLGLGIIIVSVVSIFSPYSNHPLGIGLLIIISLILDNKMPSANTE